MSKKYNIEQRYFYQIRLKFHYVKFYTINDNFQLLKDRHLWQTLSGK